MRGPVMLFSSKVSLSNLVSLCHTLRVGHGAGLSITDVFKQQARKGPLTLRPLLGRIADRLEQGDALEDVLRTQGAAFPPLFNSMVIVGEQTGNLPEIFRELERYYRMQLTLRREFIAQCIWPVIQLVGAIGVITMMILILGMIAPSEESAFDPLGFGVGIAGALRFLITVAVVLGGVVGIYFLATRGLGQKATVHRLLLSLPAIGPCLQALALSRLALALRLTMDSALSTPRAVKRSLWASGNAAYEEVADSVASDLKRGDDVHDALSKRGLFPEEFLMAVHSGEESGQLPEVMGRQAEHYHEEASLKLKILTRLASLAVWAGIALLIIWAILRIAMSISSFYSSIDPTDPDAFLRGG